MPPKKVPKDTSLVGVHEVEIMKDKELKYYIRALKEEIERMRAALYHHQKNKTGLSELLQSTEKEILYKHENLIQKNVVIQEQLGESYRLLKEEDGRNLVNVVELKEREASSIMDSFKRVQNSKMLHRDEGEYLRKFLEGREREVSRSHLDHKFVTTDMEEKREQQWLCSMEDAWKSMKTIEEQYIRKYHLATQDFVTNKSDTMADVWESILDEEKLELSIEKYAEKMSLYFKEILWKIIETTSNLKNTSNKLENELNKLKQRVRDAKRDNKVLCANTFQKNSVLRGVANADVDVAEIQNSTNSRKQSHSRQTKLSELIYENDVLTEKLRYVTHERDLIRSHFISAVRRIYQKADFKSFLLERMLISFTSKMYTNDCSSITNCYATLPKIRNFQRMSSVVVGTDTDIRDLA